MTPTPIQTTLRMRVLSQVLTLALKALPISNRDDLEYPDEAFDANYENILRIQGDAMLPNEITLSVMRSGEMHTVKCNAHVIASGSCCIEASTLPKLLATIPDGEILSFSPALCSLHREYPSVTWQAIDVHFDNTAPKRMNAQFKEGGIGMHSRIALIYAEDFEHPNPKSEDRITIHNGNAFAKLLKHRSGQYAIMHLENNAITLVCFHKGVTYYATSSCFVVGKYLSVNGYSSYWQCYLKNFLVKRKPNEAIELNLSDGDEYKLGNESLVVTGNGKGWAKFEPTKLPVPGYIADAVSDVKLGEFAFYKTPLDKELAYANGRISIAVSAGYATIHLLHHDNQVHARDQYDSIAFLSSCSTWLPDATWDAFIVEREMYAVLQSVGTKNVSVHLVTHDDTYYLRFTDADGFNCVIELRSSFGVA